MSIKVHFQEQTLRIDVDQIRNIRELDDILRINFTNLVLSFTVTTQWGEIVTEKHIAFMKKQLHSEFKLYVHQEGQLLYANYQQQNIEQAFSSNLQDENFLNQKILKESSLNNRKESFQKNPHQQYIKQEQQFNSVVNDEVQCDVCFAFPIKGTIYKCLICKDFDLCSNCQKIEHHFHPTIKIKYQDHYPNQISVTFSKESKLRMKNQQKLIYNQKLLDERQLKHKKLTIKRQVSPNSLKSKVVCSKNFLSVIFGNDLN